MSNNIVNKSGNLQVAVSGFKTLLPTGEYFIFDGGTLAITDNSFGHVAVLSGTKALAYLSQSAAESATALKKAALAYIFLARVEARNGELLVVENLPAPFYPNQPIHGVFAVPAATVDWSKADVFSKTFTDPTTLAFTNATAGQTIRLLATDDGGNALTWPGNVIWEGDTAPTPTEDETDIYEFFYDGTNYHGSVKQRQAPAAGGAGEPGVVTLDLEESRVIDWEAGTVFKASIPDTEKYVGFVFENLVAGKTIRVVVDYEDRDFTTRVEWPKVAWPSWTVTPSPIHPRDGEYKFSVPATYWYEFFYDGETVYGKYAAGSASLAGGEAKTYVRRPDVEIVGNGTPDPLLSEVTVAAGQTAVMTLTVTNPGTNGSWYVSEGQDVAEIDSSTGVLTLSDPAVAGSTHKLVIGYSFDNGAGGAWDIYHGVNVTVPA